MEKLQAGALEEAMSDAGAISDCSSGFGRVRRAVQGLRFTYFESVNPPS